jgi:hypothetical protein
MEARSTERQKLESRLEQVRKRLAAAQADMQRIAANRISSENKLAELGQQVAELKRDLMEISRQNGASSRG